MSDSDTLAGASLCSGYGGLDRAARELLGGDVVVHGEQYQPACRVLDAHWPGVPNVGDITTADWAPWAGRIDWLTAGWPCQPFSSAGKQKGTEDERAIWPAVARAIRDLRPRIVLLENVSRIVVAGELARAAGDLAALGFDAEWRCVRASDAGAPHRRERCFILAVAADRAGEGWGSLIEEHVEQDGGEAFCAGQAEPRRRDRETPADHDGGRCGWDESGTGRGPLGRAAADGDRPGGLGWDRSAGRPSVANPSSVGDPDQSRCGAQSDQSLVAVAGPSGGDRERHPAEGVHELGRAAPELAWGPYGPAVRRWELVLGRPAPDPVVVGRRGGRQLNPVFVEWLMGLPAGWVTEVAGLSRNEQLHLLGNGVVPAQALLAYRAMLPELIERTAA
ncbi:MAG TPA: DNA cytosine methyltransferase [Pseudonocardiaceae bacterium]|nr:DNA cytosine methyltransferase [Pseudonocardiaceae bacterium]